MMRRVVTIVVALAAAGIVLVIGMGAGNDDQSGTYKVRAIFNNAFTVIPGEDVKIAGVKVGKISALDVTPDNKAAVVLDRADLEHVAAEPPGPAAPRRGGRVRDTDPQPGRQPGAAGAYGDSARRGPRPHRIEESRRSR